MSSASASAWLVWQTSHPIGRPSSLPQKWSSNPARVICLPSNKYSGPMKPTTVFTSSGRYRRATA